MKNFLQNKYLLFIIRFFLGFLFVYAGIEKISNPQFFAQTISNYKLLPDFLINFSAVILPWIELVCGFGLIFGVNLKENITIYISLMGIFTLAIIISLIRGLDIECGCFGSGGSTKVGIIKILENAGTIVVACFVLIFHKQNSK